jgi:endonuclease/exonuclease/phosphatase family metal-dependent hydrolase
VAVHEHSRATLTATDPDPPSAPKFEDDAESVAWQRVVDGAVAVVVVAELPQAAATAPANINGRARNRHTPHPVCTGRTSENEGMSHRCALALGLALPLLSASTACVSSHGLAPNLPQNCREPADERRVTWQFPISEHDRRETERWCAAVGPPVIAADAPMVEIRDSTLTVVSWNTHVGGGDVSELVADLRAGRLTGGARVDAFVLLLQEVYREGSAVPLPMPDGAKSADRAQHEPGSARNEEIPATARALDLALFYAPSMRNGARTPEDRGNAILATLPLEDFTGIELPHERQRRVALAATIRGALGGEPIDLRVVSAHLSNAVAHHLWLFSSFGRARQARALVRTLTDRPIIIGGDFNTWFGSWDRAYRELARAFDTPREDGRPTFWILRLDHFFFCLPPEWHVTIHRAESRYGSDHYPLVARITRQAMGE